MNHQAFFGQRETEGLDQDAIDGLARDQEVHRWTVEGCHVYRVIGFEQNGPKGAKQARIGRRTPIRESFLVPVNRTQFHLPENCPNAEL